jgi:hypothetical protein
VEAARVLSPRVVCDLLAFAGDQMDQWWASLRLDDKGRVAWTGPEPVPMWFDIAQDLTERWVHQQQIRDAVGMSGLTDDRFLGTILRTFVWALPHHYRGLTGPDLEIFVHLEGASGSEWTLARHNEQWDLHEGQTEEPAATISLPPTDAWRHFTGALSDPDQIQRSGDPALSDHFLTARAIII